MDRLGIEPSAPTVQESVVPLTYRPKMVNNRLCGTRASRHDLDLLRLTDISRLCLPPVSTIRSYRLGQLFCPYCLDSASKTKGAVWELHPPLLDHNQVSLLLDQLHSGGGGNRTHYMQRMKLPSYRCSSPLLLP